VSLRQDDKVPSSRYPPQKKQKSAFFVFLTLQGLVA